MMVAAPGFRLHTDTRGWRGASPKEDNVIAARVIPSARTGPAPTDNFAELIDATKRYGDVLALDRVNLKIRPGEVVAMLGPNGAGKTTSVSLMLGLLQPTSGQALLFGRDPQNAASRMRAGAMLQISGLPATLKVRELVTLFSSYYPSAMPLSEVLEVAGLGEVANRPLYLGRSQKLSGYTPQGRLGSREG
jgi:ABC-type multidrug transport system ATPase subunit